MSSETMSEQPPLLPDEALPDDALPDDALPVGEPPAMEPPASDPVDAPPVEEPPADDLGVTAGSVDAQRGQRGPASEQTGAEQTGVDDTGREPADGAAPDDAAPGGDDAAVPDVIGVGSGVGGGAVPDPQTWATGDEPMTDAQRGYLQSLARSAGETLPGDLTKAQASEQIDRLQELTGRGD